MTAEQRLMAIAAGVLIAALVLLARDVIRYRAIVRRFERRQLADPVLGPLIRAANSTRRRHSIDVRSFR